MVAYTYKMPSGIAGNITRPGESTIEARLLDAATPPTAFGVPVKLVSNKMQPIASGNTADMIQGLLVRPYPTSGNGTDGLGVATPNTQFPGDLLKRGYINVKVNGFDVNAPAAMGKVFVRVGDATEGKPIGGIEAVADIDAEAVADGGNTGNGTVATLTATSDTPAGEYLATFTSATVFEVTDEGGAVVGGGDVDTEITLSNGMVIQIDAGGTAFEAADLFVITVTANTVVIPGNTYFTGTTDAYGNAEIAYNI